jgi:hypothetical protein
VCWREGFLSGCTARTKDQYAPTLEGVCYVLRSGHISQRHVDTDLGTHGARTVIIASTASTFENIIPWVVLAIVVIYVVLRQVVGPLLDSLQARKRKNEHTD